MSTEKFWRTKLAALLHDPPDKCLNIADHEETARLFQAGAGIAGVEDYDVAAVHAADHFTAAADRFGFPKGKCPTIFKTLGTGEFIHPLSSERHELPVKELLAKSGEVYGVLQSAINGIETDDPKTTLFLYWRRWLENAVASGKGYARAIALFPADSRIPDHSIWVHNAMTSALAGCAAGGKLCPALLLFQLGGVQDFIAQARSTRDLWSGSYLLSWLMAHAMKAVSDEVGPDSIVFPNLRGNGIFDALHKDSVYQVKFKNKDGDDKLWQRILKEKDDAWKDRKKDGGKDDSAGAAQWLLTPTLPNRFLAVVPAERAEELAGKAAAAIRDELQKIGEAVWRWIDDEAGEAGCQGLGNWKLRWDSQLLAFPQISWAVQPWLERDECLKELAKLPINRKEKDSPLETLQNTLRLAEEWLPEDDRDERYYADPITKTRLNNSGVFWSAHYALVDANLAARRNTHDFSAWANPWPEASVKDSLSGKEEIIGDENFWKHLHEKFGKEGSSGIKLFTSGTHKYGAMNLIKRLWCRDDQVSYLRERLGLNGEKFKKALGFDSVEEVASRNHHKGKYVAVLAMDGDEMGKWISGEKTPKFLDQLSRPAKTYLEPILKVYNCTGLRRLLTPSYHLQFSEALANFATWLAAPIVEAFGGELIYAGGDDVLAMLPADQAIPCARALRAVFRGEQPENVASMPLRVTEDGLVVDVAGYPLMVPGKKADVSIGLAIGHFQAPLQMLVKEAQAAEHRAKHDYGRGAIAFSLYKRSGEILQWGCKWESKALSLLPLLDRLSNSSEQDSESKKTEEESGGGKETSYLSGRFPYALAELLQPYQLGRELTISPSEMQEIIKREVDHVISQQGNELLKAAGKKPQTKQLLENLRSIIFAWLEECVAGEEKCQQRPDSLAQRDKLSQNKAVGSLRDFIQPFLTETFINRGSGGEI